LRLHYLIVAYHGIYLLIFVEHTLLVGWFTIFTVIVHVNLQECLPLAFDVSFYVTMEIDIVH
jgi:hypothetical protein